MHGLVPCIADVEEYQKLGSMCGVQNRGPVIPKYRTRMSLCDVAWFNRLSLPKTEADHRCTGGGLRCQDEPCCVLPWYGPKGVLVQRAGNLETPILLIYVAVP